MATADLAASTEAAIVEGIDVYPIQKLRDAYALLSGCAPGPAPYPRIISQLFD